MPPCIVSFPTATESSVKGTFGIQPLPLEQDNVTRSVAHLAESGVAYRSICVYLSGLHFFQVASGFSDPCLGSIPMLKYVLRGVHHLS